MSRSGSIVKQCKDLINGEIDCRGESKYDAKQDAIADIKSEGLKVDSHEVGQRIGIYSDSSAKQNFGYWIEAGKFIKGEFGIKDIKDFRSEHVGSFLEHKMDQVITSKTFEAVCGCMEKFSVALRWETGADDGRYDFTATIEDYRAEATVTLSDNPLVNRAYDDPGAVAGAMSDPKHTTAAELMYQGGARISEISQLKSSNLLGNNEILLTNTKGGEERTITVSPETYNKVEAAIETTGKFKINQDDFRLDLKAACAVTGENSDNGAHGFRYNFAQDSYADKLDSGMTVQQTRLCVAEELGHHRAEITERYLGR